jgi:hypothetical protein
MGIRKITLGGLAAFALMGLLGMGGPSSANAQRALPVKVPTVVLQPTEKRVSSAEELVLTLSNPNFTGRVIVPWFVRWDLSGRAGIPLNSGVSLIGERGPLGSRPLLYTNTKGKNKPAYALFYSEGYNVRVEGLHLRGPMGDDRTNLGQYVHGIRLAPNPALKAGAPIVIVDNEFDQWTGAGVDVAGPFAPTPEEYDRTHGQLRFTKEDARFLRVERNYFHENAMKGGGYGVAVAGGAYVTVEGNVFEGNRHAVTAVGLPYSGYIARFNYLLNKGYWYDGYHGQHFDVHGTGNDAHNGGPAGEYFEIAYNTIRGEQTSGGFLGLNEKTRDALTLRGRPAIGAFFHDNVLVHDGYSGAIQLKGGDDPALNALLPGTFNFRASANRWDTDYSREFATGDFDGDRRTDVFVANGTGWFFSRGGIRPWEFLHASNKRIGELGFADIDNDGVTDVLYRDTVGNLGYLKSGTHDLVNLTTTPVAIQDLRFGDFDGDEKTDIFYTLSGQWWIWYGKSRAWTPTLGASTPVSAMLFGEFDGVRGTDLVAALPSDWALSSGAAAGWVKLNDRRLSSLAGAVAADFDGNGRSDIAYSEGKKWYVSRDGRSPFTLLRNGDGHAPYPGLKNVLLGQFEGGPRTQAVTLNLVDVLGFFLPGERLVIWDGREINGDFQQLSEQNMR